MDKKVFSAVIITYNQKDFIAQTLDSVLAQRHSYPYEIIVGDDASTDGTQAVLKYYKEKYPDIITLILNEKNLGIVGNYYKTIASASGKYIMECAGDDYWLPGKVEKQIGFMESHPDCGMCFTNVYDLIDGKFVLENPDRYTDFESFITKGGVVPGPTPCCRRSLFLEYTDDVRPLEKNWLMEDCPLWLWFTKNTKVKYFPEALAVYRLFRDSACHSSDIEKQKHFVDSLCDVHNFFARKYDFPLQKDLRDMFLGNYLTTQVDRVLQKSNSFDLKTIRLLFKELKSPTAKQKMFYMFSYIPPLYTFVYLYRKVKKMLKK
jgi:glycosyltransferases involved in cell wall biogenesis|nr:glycosyltransferase [Treponema socranskii]